jgi:hypothetical protein
MKWQLNQATESVDWQGVFLFLPVFASLGVIHG